MSPRKRVGLALFFVFLVFAPVVTISIASGALVPLLISAVGAVLLSAVLIGARWPEETL